MKKQLEFLSLELQILKSEKDRNHNKTQAFSDLSKFEILGVKISEDKKLIKKNYKSLANIYHPDRCGSETVMRAINNAYDEVLKR